jgi:hypothetical protein
MSLQNIYFKIADPGLTDQTAIVWAQVSRKNEYSDDTILTKGIVYSEPVTDHWELHLSVDSTAEVVGTMGSVEFLRKTIVVSNDDSRSLSSYL